MWDWGNLQGLIPICGGVLVFLYAKGILPRTTKDPAGWELWRQKYGSLMIVLGPILVIFGCLLLAGVF